MQFLFTDNCFVSLHYTPALYWFRRCLSVLVFGVVNYLVIYVFNRPRCLFSAPPTLTRSQDGKRITISPPETLHTTLQNEMSSPSEAQWSFLKQDRFLLWRIWKSGRSTLKIGWWCLILCKSYFISLQAISPASQVTANFQAMSGTTENSPTDKSGG